MATRGAVPVFEEHWRRYDEWYDRNPVIYETELRAVRRALANAPGALSVEVGVGTGRFAAPLRIWLGVDPARNMLVLAKKRGVETIEAVGEHLPLRTSSLHTALLVVTLCFVDDPRLVLGEAARVARRVVSCIVPRLSPWGRYYEARRSQSPFYQHARFYTVAEVVRLYESLGLRIERCTSTLYTPPPGPTEPEEPRDECSEEAGFACIAGVKDTR